MLFSQTLPTLESMKSFLTGKSDRILPCCGNKETEAHAVTCHAGKDVEIFERLFSMKEVAHHCDPQSCWVVVDNVVYDLTEFQYEHPGGMDIILENAGRDCTGVFEDVGHSKWAAQLLQKYRIGMLPEDERIVL